MKSKKKSLKTIPPTLRNKKRYVVFELIAEREISEFALKNSLSRLFFDLFGQYGFSHSNYSFVLFNSKTRRAIIKCRRSWKEKTKTALLFLEKIDSIACIPRIITVSGSAKKAKKFVLEDK